MKNLTFSAYKSRLEDISTSAKKEGLELKIMGVTKGRPLTSISNYCDWSMTGRGSVNDGMPYRFELHTHSEHQGMDVYVQTKKGIEVHYRLNSPHIERKDPFLSGVTVTKRERKFFFFTKEQSEYYNEGNGRDVINAALENWEQVRADIMKKAPDLFDFMGTVPRLVYHDQPDIKEFF